MIIEYFTCDRQEYWLEQIGKCDWAAGRYLHRLLSENRLAEALGANPKVLMLTDKDELLSFCTYSELDDIQPTELTPWVGFVYTFPQHRGHHYSGILLEKAEKTASEEGKKYIYISTNEVGLYEKYGYDFLQFMEDIYGETSRVYVKCVGEIFG